MLQIVDVSDYILYTDYKAKNQVTSMINACVSHELRNPLNSIIAKNIEKGVLYKQLINHISALAVSNRNDENYLKCLSIIEELEQGKTVQQNSAMLMNYMIQDLLYFAQIKAGKFRKNIKPFNIRDAIQKVMST